MRGSEHASTGGEGVAVTINCLYHSTVSLISALWQRMSEAALISFIADTQLLAGKARHNFVDITFVRRRKGTKDFLRNKLATIYEV